MVDRSLLTGESCPVAVTVGSSIEAGTDNIQSSVLVRVDRTGTGYEVGRDPTGRHRRLPNHARRSFSLPIESAPGS